MKVKISEVWNKEGKNEELAVIETMPHRARIDVVAWIEENRPDLKLAITIDAHGYHAVAVDLER